MKLKLICLIAILALAGCAQEDIKKANPASEHCIEQGGTLEIVDTEDGQVGMCELPDGTICEEWDYYEGECPTNESTQINSFEECVEAGNTVMESYPRKCEANGQVFVENLSLQEKCQNLHNGEWLSEFSECEGVTENACNDMGGKFNQCASACRHQPNATVCTMQCVPVCSFSETSLAEKCENNGGKWLPEFQECEGINEQSCNQMNGDFDQCASACRNDPDADVCTKQCVFVCDFNNEQSLAETCENKGGEWLEEHQECEFISEEKCTETGGEFSECESACRHQEADMCTQQCVPVCKY